MAEAVKASAFFYWRKRAKIVVKEIKGKKGKEDLLKIHPTSKPKADAVKRIKL
ncbi:MAG: hypothetical protein E6176_11685 [Clostridium celatum]|nr:hypothetical protein [Clostridium celatum]